MVGAFDAVVMGYRRWAGKDGSSHLDMQCAVGDRMVSVPVAGEGLPRLSSCVVVGDLVMLQNRCFFGSREPVSVVPGVSLAQLVDGAK